MAVIRGQYLWTCHHVGLDGPDEAYNGEDVDRSAIQWFKVSITETGHLELQNGNDWGRIWDASASQPRWYYFPSLMVNAGEQLAIGFSGSSETSFVGAYYCGRSGVGGTVEGPVLIQAGKDYFDHLSWCGRSRYGMGRIS